MKIAIDVRMIGPFTHGISRYAYNLIKIMSEIDKKNNYLLISNDNYLRDFASSRDNFTLKVIRSKLYGIYEQFIIPRLLKNERVDIFHSPSYFGPVYGSCRTIMTIHDIIPLLFPRKYSILHKLYYRVVVKKAAENANMIITVSENSRNDINKHLGIPLEKIVVTYNAVDEVFNMNRIDKINSIKNKFGINDRYLLYVGNQKPHKNVDQLIRAYNLLRNRIKHQLVIIGQRSQATLRCLSRELLEGVVFAGEVSDDNLSCLYSGADLYVSTSLYEGFGLPLLEAMVCGTPVVVLRTPPLSEIIGDSGYMVEGDSPEEFADAVCNILSDVNKQKSMVEKGLERVKLFSWKKTASITLKLYEEVAKTKILYINLRSDYGGGPSHMFDLVTSLSSSFEKYVACPIQKPFYNLYEEKKITVFPLPFRSFSILSFFKLVRFTKRNYIDIIHSHGKGAGIYSRLLGFFTRKPVIHTFHGIHYKKYSYWVQMLYFIIERRLSKFTNYIINVSDNENVEGLQLRLFPKSKARVICNGVDIDTICKSSIDTKLQKLINSIKKDNILICTVARFDYVKGIDVAIKAMKCLIEFHKNFKYILIGDGELNDEIVKEINNCHMNNQILLLGFRDDVPGILKMMDVYLSPSRSEGMSLTLLEAMGIGLPVVATDIPGNRYLIKNGLLARPENPLDIAEKISMLIKNPKLRKNLSEEGKINVKESYTLERMIRNTESLYYELLAPKELSLSTTSLRKKREKSKTEI